MVSNEDSGYSLALGGFAYDCFDRLWTSVCINPYIHSDVSYADTQNGSLFRYADSVKDNSFSALFRDLAIFFGSILGFVAGFLLGTFASIDIAVWFGVIGAIISLLLWGMISTDQTQTGKQIDENSSNRERVSDAFARVAGDTCFVTVWVIFAYLLYELGVLFSGVDLQAMFSVWGPMVPLIAILVGFIPGCGPQVIVAAMYLNGTVPLSAELGNAISNDGDALFPAIAMAPKAAVIATLYSAVPALIVAYSYYWLFE